MVKEKRIEQVLKKKYLKEFKAWMTGQTVGINEDKSIEIYDQDFVRWLNDLQVVD